MCSEKTDLLIVFRVLSMYDFEVRMLMRPRLKTSFFYTNTQIRVSVEYYNDTKYMQSANKKIINIKTREKLRV